VVQHLFDVLDQTAVTKVSECIREQSSSLAVTKFGANVLIKVPSATSASSPLLMAH
jgi:hypothetical protein